jgi:hypothetical protein
MTAQTTEDPCPNSPTLASVRRDLDPKASLVMPGGVAVDEMAESTP